MNFEQFRYYQTLARESAVNIGVSVHPANYQRGYLVNNCRYSVVSANAGSDPRPGRRLR